MSQTATAAEQPMTMDEVAQRAKDKGGEVKEQAGSRLQEEVATRTQQAAQQVQTFSQTLRRTASELRAQGQNGQSEILDQAAIRLEQVGSYLTQSEPQQLLDDAKQYGGTVVGFVRKQPALIAVAGLGLGTAASRMAGRLRSQQAA